MQTDMTIAKKSNRPKGLDYKQLYDLGMARIRSLCSEKWTDYNTHDYRYYPIRNAVLRHYRYELSGADAGKRFIGKRA